MVQNETLSIGTAKANEAAVLGSMLIDNDTIPDVLLLLPDDNFLLPENRLISRAIRELYHDQSRKSLMGIKPHRIDAVVLRNKLDEMGYPDTASIWGQDGCVAYLAKVLESIPSSANARYYAARIRETHKRLEVDRKLSELTKLTESCTTSDEKIQTIKKVASELEPLSRDMKLIDISDDINEAGMALLHHEGQISTGFFRIDQIISGFTPDDFVILGARPSMGKTSLALNIACNLAISGNNILFFSKEMKTRRLIQRIICTRAAIQSHKIRQDTPDTDEEREKLLDYLNRYPSEPLPITISDTFATPSDIQMLIRQYRQRREPALVIIDYIQLLSSGHRDPDLRHTVTEISKQLKQININEGIPILALSQLNRLAEGRSDHRPHMSDLKESGALEQDADIIMLLHREDYYHQGETKWLEEHREKIGLTELIIAKNRNGFTGIAELVFCPDYCEFRDLSHTDDGEIPPSDKRDDVTSLYDNPEPGPYGGKGDDAA